MKVKRMGITEILRRICLFSANKIKRSESYSKQPTQHIVELNSSLRHIIVTQEVSVTSSFFFESANNNFEKEMQCSRLQIGFTFFLDTKEHLEQSADNSSL